METAWNNPNSGGLGQLKRYALAKTALNCIHLCCLFVGTKVNSDAPLRWFERKLAPRRVALLEGVVLSEYVWKKCVAVEACFEVSYILKILPSVVGYLYIV